ncbi:MAG: PAS domain S-box protein [Methanoregulaceae archaeon]|nr:PAS domain S-box protein [Methanoregulaceae archaeon]
MNIPENKRSFSFYLLVFIITFLTVIVVGITIGDLILVNNNFQDNAELLRNETENNLIESVATIDNGLKLFDNTLNNKMQQGFVIFHQGYREAGGDPSLMNLTELKKEVGGEMDLYIINESGVIEYTTYTPELGLNFKEKIPYFYDYLMEIRTTDGFYPDRVVQESATGNLKKYAYYPTYDHRYILELGLSAEAFNSERNTLRYTDMIESVSERSHYISQLRIFTTAKRQVGNKSFKPDAELNAILEQVLSTRQSLVIPDNDPRLTTKYLYIDLRDEDYAADMSLIVEIVYDDALIIQSQQHLIAFHLLVAVFGLMLGVVGAYGLSRYLTRPIAQIADDTDTIARGNLDHRIAPPMGREFGVLEQSINALVQSLKGMIRQMQLSERKLRESEERYRGVVESQSEFITRFRPDGTITFANEAYCRYFGFEDCNINGLKFMPSIPDDDRKRLNEQFRQLSPEHPEMISEHRIIMPNGEIRWQQWSDRAIFGPDMTIIEYQSVGRDITEKKQIEQNLTDSEKRFRDLATLLPQVIFEVDLTGKITYVNQPAYDIFGYSPGELEKGINIYQIIMPEEHEQALLNFRNALLGLKNEGAEYHMMRKDGSKLVTMVYSSPIIREDAVVGIRGILVDITQLKLVEDAIRQLNEELEVRVAERTRDLEAANRELDSFSYSVSHDLRAPLRAIDGFSMILLHEYAKVIPTEITSYLLKIRENTQRMGVLIDDLLNFSRMSRLPLQRFLVDPSAIAREAYEEFRLETVGRQVDFIMKEMPACSADPNLLNRVYTNLLSNALKFTRGRDVARIEVGSMMKDRKMVYYVKDNGIGFDMKYAQKLFGVFQRLHDDPSIEGTGVGLAIVERIIHRHGGEIWAESVPGEGTTFFFTLG